MNAPDRAIEKSDTSDRLQRLIARRREARKVLSLTLRLTPLDEHGTPLQAMDGRTLDISSGGLSVVVPRMCHIGERLLVEIRVAGAPVKFMCGVVRNHEYRQGEGCKLGVQFQQLPDMQTVQDWIAARSKAAA